MSDARLRDLERQAATGDLAAGARLLLQRERLGHVTRVQLELAAHAGDAAAARALGVSPTDDAAGWARGFYRFGRDVCVRVTATVTATLLERGPPLLRRGGPEQLAALEALRPWLACPCEAHAAPAIAAARRRAFELPSLPGVVLALDWPDDAPAFVLRGGLSLDAAERARARIQTSGGAADLARDAADGTWRVRLRERFPPAEKIALVRDVRAISGLGLAEALGAVEGVNAVVRVIHDATQALGLDVVRAVVGVAVVAPAARSGGGA